MNKKRNMSEGLHRESNNAYHKGTPSAWRGFLLKHLHGVFRLNSTNTAPNVHGGTTQSLNERAVALQVDTHHMRRRKDAVQQRRHQTSTIVSDLTSMDSSPQSCVLHPLSFGFVTQSSFPPTCRNRLSHPECSWRGVWVSVCAPSCSASTN